MKNRIRVFGALVFASVTLSPSYASAQSWQCQIQIPKSGSVSSWCGMSAVNVRVNGSRGSGWSGMEAISLSIRGNRVSGWIGMNPVSLSKSGSFVSGWVGQEPFSCRVIARNNFCLIFTATDPS
jgi:hypothetical protein